MRLLAFAVLAFLGAAIFVLATRSVYAQGRPAYRADEVIIGFHRNARTEDRASLRAQLHGQRLRVFGLINAELLRIKGMSVEQAVARLRNHPLVEYIEPNYEVHALVVPNDPMFSQLYAMQNTGQTGGTPGADIRATDAWNQFTGDPDLKIGVIDTGVDYNHPDLVANIWTNPNEIPANGIDDDDNGYVDDVHGYDFVNLDGDPIDDNGHGTLLAGTISAVGNNQIGVVGVNWQAKVVAIKLLGANGGGVASDAIDALQYAITVGVRVTNNSWGNLPFSQALLDAINAAGAAGELFVAAAGNDGSDNDLSPFYPASFNTPYVIAVAASDHNDALAAFSNFGQTSVDLAAPGVNIVSTLPGGNYGSNSGTSMAAPYVTGAVALVRGHFQALSPLQAKDVILNSADPLPAFAGKVLTGGRLNLLRAVGLDSIPPESVTSLAGSEPGSNTVRLTWIAPGDDGSTGWASRYDIRYSSVPITEAGFANAISVPGPNPQVAGSPESLLVAGLVVNTTYYFALKAFDEFDNSSFSNVISATTLGIPDIAAMPTSFSQGLPTGGTATQTLTLKNDAEGTLDFTIPAPEFLGPAGWLTVQPGAGRIAAGDSMPVQLQFHGLGLGTGDYNANLRVLSNDPDEGSITLPVTMHVVGTPALAVNPESLDFGTLFPGESRSLTLTVSNSGTDPLAVSGITSSVPSVTVAPGSFTFAPAGLQVVWATWSPVALGPLAGTLTLNSNDPAQPSRAVAMSGNAVPAPTVPVISQVYGGGGNTGAPFKHDYIELFNRGTVPVNVGGWSVQYASATGSTWQTTPLSGTIPAGGYYLIQEAAGAGGGANLPMPDASGGIPMSLSSGKVALVSSTTALTGTCPSGGGIVDFVGYGAANCSETSPTGTLSNTTADIRRSGGCDDTDQNLADFTIATPAPRNSAIAPHSCQHTLVITVDPPGSGSVARLPDLGLYAHGSSVQVTATAVGGYHFTSFAGDVTGSANPRTVVMDADKAVVAHFSSTASGGLIVISQVYGGGGNTGAPFKNDYIELFNRGTVPINVGGWSAQYASAGGSTWRTTPLSGTIPAGGYYLIQEAAGVGGGANLPTPDASGGIPMSLSSGKVALVSGTTALTDTCPNGGGIVDFVGYGAANCSETSPTGTLSNTTADIRRSGGCDDTDQNLANFTIATPAPRNSASSVSICPGGVAVGDAPVTEFSLGRPAPNPASGTLHVPFTLPREARVQLEVIDVQGRVVARLVEGTLPAGQHDVTWNIAAKGGGAKSGVYFIRLNVPGRVCIRRAIVTN